MRGNEMKRAEIESIEEYDRKSPASSALNTVSSSSRRGSGPARMQLNRTRR